MLRQLREEPALAASTVLVARHQDTRSEDKHQEVQGSQPTYQVHSEKLKHVSCSADRFVCCELGAE